MYTWAPNGVAVKQHDSSVGQDIAAVTPVGAGWAATASFELYKEGTAFRVRVQVRRDVALHDQSLARPDRNCVDPRSETFSTRVASCM